MEAKTTSSQVDRPPHPPPSVNYVTGNSLEINATTTTCSDEVSTSSPSVTPTKSVRNATTSTNQTPGHDVETNTYAGGGECHICEKKVHLATHQCYIQRLKQDVDDPKTKRVSRDEVGTRPFTEPEPDDPDTRVLVEREPPLQVYCDYEAITDAEGNQTPILLCAETDGRRRDSHLLRSGLYTPFLQTG